MPDKILESVLSGQLDLELLLTWLRGDNFEDAGEDCLLRNCGRNEFTAYFLSYLRAETESIVENDSSARTVVCATPDRSEGRVHRRTASDPTADTPARPHLSPSREKKRSGRKVKTKLFTDEKTKEPTSPDDARISTGMDRLMLASTPLKSESACSSPRDTRSPGTPVESRGRHSRLDATLGDFLSVSTATHSRGKKKKRDSRNSDDLDTSAEKSADNGSGRKSTSLRSEKRRIKPTNIDLGKQSLSLSSFGTEFQKVGALALENNEVFSAPPLLTGGSLSGSPGFAAERDALRRERHRLLEKFSSLSAATSPKCSTPLIKISQEESFVYPDVSKVTSEDAIAALVSVYRALLDSHLVLTYTSELCFLLALVRGRQRFDAGPSASSVLRSVHNAACFAARALRSQRGVLAALLDRPELRALAEARVTKTMAPDLAKSLLDVYSLRGEATNTEPPPPAAGHVVAWNTETDGADNFPSALSFHSFKKQRDMFYEIARWYEETGGGAGGGGPSLRTRVRALAAAGAAGGQGNYAHLGALIARHALANTAGGSQAHESRLSKLNRRLTRPPAHQTNALFTPEEEFYRELVSCTENEPFRAAVRDALATELMALDAMAVHTGAALVSVSRAACTLGRLLGLLTALPHCPLHQPATPRLQRHLPYMLALRSAEMPSLDVTRRVLEAARAGRLCVTLPWTSAYLSTLAAYDPVAPRLAPYTALLRLLRSIYRRALPLCPPRTALYLRCTLSSLFGQQNIPQEVLYEEDTDPEHHFAPSGLDAADIITEAEIAPLLAARRELAAMLAGTGAAARHVTPLRVGPSPNRASHTYTHVQKRLEEAVVRGCGGGARRVLELVCERVSAAALASLTRALSAHRHKPAAPCDVTHISAQGAGIRAQLQAALNALLSERGCRGAECALAERAVRARLARHTRDTAELCDAAAAALRTLVGGAWGQATPPSQATPPAPVSQSDVATALIELKECVCQCLERAPPGEVALCAALGAAGRAGASPARGPKRTALMLSLELCVAAACCSRGTLTEAILLSAERVWVACAPRARDGGPTDDPPQNTNDKGVETEQDDYSDIFARLISPRVVRQVAYGADKQWDAFKQLVLFCTERGWLCANKLTESCVALYSRDYSQDVLCGLGAWLRGVAGALGAREGGDAHTALFLGFLGEYCDDL